MKANLLTNACSFDAEPSLSKAVRIQPNGLASVTLVIPHIVKEEEFGIVRIRIQGSNDAENWQTIEDLDFSGASSETLSMREPITSTFVRAIAIPVDTLEAIVTADIEFALK